MEAGEEGKDMKVGEYIKAKVKTSGESVWRWGE